jgi:hypothetical protein
MNSLDDNEVIIHHGTGNFLGLRIGKRGHATKIFLSDVDSGAVEVEAGGETENIRQHAWSLLPVDTSRFSGFFQELPTEEKYTLPWRLARVV